jgi:2,3-bisphosphoglycerate-dependent phosphoglycerate mutase
MLQQLYLIRHAHPQQGTGIPYDRVPGPPLSEVGREEARAAALYLSQCGLQQLYASPLDRTSETARAIVSQTGITMLVEDALAEHRNDEAMEKVTARIRDFLARVDCEPVEVAGFVTHGSPIKALLQLLSSETIDLTKHVYDNGNHAPTAGIWRAERISEGWKVELVFTPSMVRTY